MWNSKENRRNACIEQNATMENTALNSSIQCRAKELQRDTELRNTNKSAVAILED